jgi:hypothetical protein
MQQAISGFTESYIQFLNNTQIKKRLKLVELGSIAEIPERECNLVQTALDTLHNSSRETPTSPETAALLEKLEWKWNRLNAALKNGYNTSSEKGLKLICSIEQIASTLKTTIAPNDSTSATISDTIADLLEDFYFVQECLIPNLSQNAEALLKDEKATVVALQQFMKKILAGERGYLIRERMLSGEKSFLYNQQSFLRLLLADCVVESENPSVRYPALFGKIPQKTISLLTFQTSDRTKNEYFYRFALQRPPFPEKLNTALTFAVACATAPSNQFNAFLEFARPYAMPNSAFLKELALKLVSTGDFNRAFSIALQIVDSAEVEGEVLGHILFSTGQKNPPRMLALLQRLKEKLEFSKYNAVVQALCMHFARAPQITLLEKAVQFSANPNDLYAIIVEHTKTCLHTYSELNAEAAKIALLHMCKKLPPEMAIDCISKCLTVHVDATNECTSSYAWFTLLQDHFKDNPPLISCVGEQLLLHCIAKNIDIAPLIFKNIYTSIDSLSRQQLLRGISHLLCGHTSCIDAIARIKKVALLLENQQEASSLYGDGYLVLSAKRCGCKKESELLDLITDARVRRSVEKIQNSAKDAIESAILTYMFRNLRMDDES